MTTYIIVNSLVIFIVFILLLYLFFNQMKLNGNMPTSSSIPDRDKLNQITSLGWIVKVLLLFAFCSIALSFISPFLLTRPAINTDFDFSKTGQIGDTISGLMNPFIAIAGVFVTGIAFYIQYKANILQRELFIQEQSENKQQLQQQIDNQNRQTKIQQFESQFYEMLKLHRDNINEMKITGYDFEEDDSLLKNKFTKITEGRKCFVTMKTELECVMSIISKQERKLNKETFKKCYELFFLGFDEFKKAHPDETDIISIIVSARNQHEKPDLSIIKSNQDRKTYQSDLKLFFNYKPFSGHMSRLGHYFRHLYLTVKSIANSEVVTDYEERMKYLRILRAQLSHHEQILLFYNWLSGFGDNWENDKNSFFTEYCMIHNLWYHNLFEDQFINEKVNYLRTKEVEQRKGKMFEID